jgi:hypothetical protein
VISTKLIDVHPKPKRAHQGWRYLEEADAPADLADGESADMLPPSLAGELAKLGLASGGVWEPLTPPPPAALPAQSPAEACWHTSPGLARPAPCICRR